MTARPPRGLTRKPSSSPAGTFSHVSKSPSETHSIKASKASLSTWSVAGVGTIASRKEVDGAEKRFNAGASWTITFAKNTIDICMVVARVDKEEKAVRDFWAQTLTS